MSMVAEREVVAGAVEPSAPPRVHRGRRPGIPPWAISALALLGGLVTWWIVARLGIWSPIFVPTPESVAQKLIQTMTVHDGQVGYAGRMLWEHLGVTLQRILIGAAFAVLLGVPIGLAIGLVPVLRYAFGPAITFLRQLPPLAYFSILIIWFGIDESPKIVLLFIAAMPPIIVATAAGIEGVDRDYLHAARSLGARRLQLVREVLLPAALPDIFTGIRLGVGVAYTSVVAAETVNGLPGIGGMIRDAQRYNQTAVVILGILVLGLTGLVIESCLTRLQARMTPWRGRM